MADRSHRAKTFGAADDAESSNPVRASGVRPSAGGQRCDDWISGGRGFPIPRRTRSMVRPTTGRRKPGTRCRAAILSRARNAPAHPGTHSGDIPSGQSEIAPGPQSQSVMVRSSRQSWHCHIVSECVAQMESWPHQQTPARRTVSHFSQKHSRCRWRSISAGHLDGNSWFRRLVESRRNAPHFRSTFSRCFLPASVRSSSCACVMRPPGRLKRLEPARPRSISGLKRGYTPSRRPAATIRTGQPHRTRAQGRCTDRHQAAGGR